MYVRGFRNIATSLTRDRWMPRGTLRHFSLPTYISHLFALRVLNIQGFDCIQEERLKVADISDIVRSWLSGYNRGSALRTMVVDLAGGSRVYRTLSLLFVHLTDVFVAGPSEYDMFRS